MAGVVYILSFSSFWNRVDRSKWALFRANRSFSDTYIGDTWLDWKLLKVFLKGGVYLKRFLPEKTEGYWDNISWVQLFEPVLFSWNFLSPSNRPFR